MSVRGLEQSERIARRTQSKVKQALDRTAEEVKAEIDKLQYLLSERQAARRWASSPANAEKLAQIRSRMNEVEQLYLDAGDTEAARIFRRRTEAALKQRLTNLKAAELDVKTIMAKGRQQGEAQVISGLTEVRREGAVGEMYNQARSAGGFLVNFGRQYLNDVVTLQTKAAGSKTIGKYMANIYTQYEDQIKDVFVNGIVRGDSYEMMTDGLANATGLSKRKSELVIRTEANAIFNESIKDVIQDNPLVKGYRFRAVLDSKTSKICQKHDGEYIPKDKIKPGVNFPPLHPNCRSTVTTVLADEDERKDTMQRYTKNGRNQWEKVPPGMTYQEYKDKFGFANSKNPRTYNPETRDIHDKTLARITVPQYKGYVKPSRSATARIQKMLKAYREGDDVYIDCLKTNTGFDKVAKALARQAQAESGFDGLPLQQTAEQFNKTVEKNGYRVLWRQFGREEDEASFLEGDGLYGKGSISFGAGTYAYNEAPTKENYGRKPLRMALKSPEEKILRFVGAETDKDIRNAQTPDDRINEALKAFQPAERKDAFAALAVEYGYDAVDARSETEGTNYTIVLNRTALIVEKPQVEEQSDFIPMQQKVRDYINTLQNDETKKFLENSPVLDQLDLGSVKAYVATRNGQYLDNGVLMNLDPVIKAEERKGDAGSLWVEGTEMTPEVQADVSKVYAKYTSSIGSKQKGKKASLIMGLPASGKSTAIADRLVKQQGAFLADSDEVKKLFVPDVLGEDKDYYQRGNGANYIHDASSYINAEALKVLTKDGTNIVLPIVGKSESSVQKYYDIFKNAGYDMSFYMVELPKKKAIGRSFGRFVKEGRYVSLDYLDKIDVTAIEANFDKFKKMEGVSYYERLNNDVAFGEAPRSIESSGKN